MPSRWQYMAERDMPAVMDKVLKVTHQSKVYLAGQSMGGTILFAFLSENHNYDNNVGLPDCASAPLRRVSSTIYINIYFFLDIYIYIYIHLSTFAA